MAFTYRTTDSTKWGTGKDTPLTFAEMDENLWALNNAYNIKNYGALTSDTTGTTNLAAIQAAIDAAYAAGGGTVVVPAGTYLVSCSAATTSVAAIRLKSNVTLAGVGWSSILKVVSGTLGSDCVFIGNDQTLGLTKIHVKSLQIDGNSSTKGIMVLYGRSLNGGVGATYSSVKDCYVHSHGYIAIQAKDFSHYFSAIGNTCEGGDYGVQSTASTNCVISDNIIYNTSDNAIDVYGDRIQANITTTDTFVYGELVTGGTSSATAYVKEVGSGYLILQGGTINAASPTNFTNGETITGGTSSASATYDSTTNVAGNWSGAITGNSINTCKNGVFLETVESVSCTGNAVRNATQYGVKVNRIHATTRGNSVTGNTFFNNTLGGVAVVGVCENTVVSGNTVDGGSYGVLLNGCYYTTVTGNTFYNTNETVRLQGTGTKNFISDNTFNLSNLAVNIATSTQTDVVIAHNQFHNVTNFFERPSSSYWDFRFIPVEADGYQSKTISAGNITIDFSAGTVIALDNVNSNVNIPQPIYNGTPISSAVRDGLSAMWQGKTMVVMFTQDSTGGHQVVWNNVYANVAAVSNFSNKKSTYTFRWQEPRWYSVSELTNF